MVNGFAGHAPVGRLAALSADPRVLRVIPDRTVFAKAKPAGGGGGGGQVVPEGVKRIGAAPGSGSESGVIAGLDWVGANAALVTPPIRAVNMSLGREGALNDNPTQRAAIQNLVAKGAAVIVAAGNDASLEVSQQVPATYPEVIAIASTTAKAGTSSYNGFSGVIGADTASHFTSDGAFNSSTGIGVSISAPGATRENISRAGFLQSVGILSTSPGGGTTSMACPP